MATPENPIIVDLTDSYGFYLIGLFLSCAFWGVSSLQAFIYLSGNDSDHWSRKALVAFLWVVDTVNEIIILQSIWSVFIQNYGSIQGLSKTPPFLVHHAWIAQILECCVQLYFAYRIYIYSEKRWAFPAFMAVLSVFQLVVLIPYDVFVYGGSTAQAFQRLSAHKAVSIVIVLRAVTTAEDVMLTCALMYLLLKKGLPQYHQSKKMVYRLLIVTANTGMWTAVVAVIELSLVAAFPNGLQFTLAEWPLCSLYFSSFLASLNSRTYIKGSSPSSWNDTPSSFRARTQDRSGTVYLAPMGLEGTQKTYTNNSTVENDFAKSATHVDDV